MTLLVVAWGYLVMATIDFGAEARGGRDEAWWFLALASVGAMACLFAGLILLARMLRLLTAASPSSPSAPSSSPGDSGPRSAAVPRGEGGRRAR